ncbi:uroporphyrinogen-III C-methyltransferase [Parathalassolituus penaei]|uniref:Uroporphyrinogen-III C-methyltransferase n=1 Tax=Parathalassolituus penaei TaxID=2997323 RepID=A0A9X3ECT4_9GAMM|nr:uroporphyrinogen-III C-methyltransferase [Parathalassolituus penaei]MCY0965219.1 uroporphyrinogen-III C-methyltransferase [Parathalassolituus penaei]
MNELDKPEVQDESAVAAESSAPTASKEKETAEPQADRPANRAALPWVLAGINLLLLAGASGWLYTQWQQTARDLQTATTQQNSLEGQLLEQGRRLEYLNERSQGALGFSEKLEGEMSAVQRQLAHNTEALQRLPGAERQDWLLAEVEYLLRLASQRLQLERDVKGAIGMLDAADTVLVELDNPALSSVRQHIANELMALRQVPSLDRTGVVLRLQALQDAVDNLPWLPRHEFELVPAPPSEAGVSNPAWYLQLWTALREGVGQVIRIRRNDQPMDTPMSQEQAWQLQQSMRLMLEQAQVAFLRGDQQLYEHSLLRVNDWLDDYLSGENDASTAVRNGLKEVAGWQVAPTLPDISGSLLSLRHLLDQQRRGVVGETAQ